MSMVRKALVAAGWVLGVGGICAALLLAWPVPFVFGIDRSIARQQRMILYQIDHHALASLLRDFADQRWLLAEPPKGSTAFAGDDPSVPPALRLLKPSSVIIDDEAVSIEFGGALLHYGISAFRPGVVGAGEKQLGEGIWFYSENGRHPAKP